MVYRFIDENKKYFGLRWLCLKFNISTNCYYNYLKNKKYKYYKKLNDIYERIKYIYYTNNRVIGHRIMGVLLRRYGIYLSKTTVHKYMNKALNLTAVIMRKKTKCTNLYKKHKIFDNLINQNFKVLYQRVDQETMPVMKQRKLHDYKENCVIQRMHLKC